MINCARAYIYVYVIVKETSCALSLIFSFDKIGTEGLVADMVCNLVLPEVDRELSRKRLHERQMSHLYAAHESIYHEILNIPDEDLLSERTLESDSSNSAAEKLTSYESAVYGNLMNSIVDTVVNCYSLIYCAED